MRATERQRGSGHTRPAWPGNADVISDAAPIVSTRFSLEDSHTLDRPMGEDGAEFHTPPTRPKRHNPLDHNSVVEEADSQGWGS